MRAWQFGRPKNPGFGISSGFYLTVLASRAVLPSIRMVANPKKEHDAVEGFGVPLGATGDKSLLDRPMERGSYVIATRDQKTVLKLDVVSKDEIGFDPEAFANSTLALTVGQEALARIRGTWTLCQLAFKSHEPMVYPALDFLLAIAMRLADISDGVVADAIAQRYLLPGEVFSQRRRALALKVYAEEHVSIKLRARPDGIHAYTLGLQKFVLPELEILNLMDGDERASSTCLLWLAQQILEGAVVKEGYQIGAPGMPFEVREGGFDQALWSGTPVYELLPPTKATATEAVRAWEAEIARTSR